MDLQNKNNPRITALNELMAEVVYQAIQKVVPAKYSEECFIGDDGNVYLNTEQWHTIVFPVGAKLYGMEVFYGDADRAVLSPKRKVHLSKEDVVNNVKALLMADDMRSIVDAWQRQDEEAEMEETSESEDGAEETADEALNAMKKEWADNYTEDGKMMSLNEHRDPKNKPAYSNTMGNRKLQFGLIDGQYQTYFVDKKTGQRLLE